MVIDKILKGLGLSYTTRHHLTRTAKGTDWRFLLALLLLLAFLVFIVIELA
jgi:uncharacterized integral membrane protein